MALPSIATPEYKTNIPSTGKEITFRPFLVKEEKLLLTAQESGEQKDQIMAIANILAACISTPGIEIGQLATFDMEYLFLKLRAKSVGEVIQINVPHQEPAGPSGSLENSCTHRTDITINIDEVEVLPPVPDTKIQITDDIGVSLRFPTFQDLATDEDTTTTAYIFKLLANCVEFVYDKEEVYNDFTKKEVSEWIDALSQDQFQKISQFYENLPRIRKPIEWKCEACGKKESMTLEGLESFFS